MSECNEFGVSAQDFEAQFCFRCLQPECSRSQHGKSRFEARIGNWEQRLFTSIPRMPESDPRYITLHTKKFVDIDPGRIPEIGRAPAAWIDPRDLDVAPESPQSSGQPKNREPEPEAPAPLASVAPEAQEEPRPAPTAVPKLMNTPVQQGRMIGGSKPAPPRDPWEVKAPTETTGIKVVKPGARIKIGGSGV